MKGEVGIHISEQYTAFLFRQQIFSQNLQAKCSL